MRFSIGGLARKLFILFVAGAGQALAQPTPTTTEPLIIESQGSFFVGGREQKSDTLGPPNSPAMPGTITVDQVYVRYQTPPDAHARPNIVLIHGCCLTGKTWETTPDGRMGWDEYFVRRGFSTYVIDQAWRGRSAFDPSTISAVRYRGAPVATLPPVFSASHEGAWAPFRFGPKYGVVFPDLKFPIGAVNELWKQMTADFAIGLPVPNPTVPALSELAERVGPSILISHSQSGIYPFQAVASNGHNIAGIIAIEPGTCPSATEDMLSYKAVPILVLFGDHTAESPIWAPVVKGCRDYINALHRAGGRAEIIVLPEIGIKGNTHMLMQDLNNLQIADMLINWIATSRR